LTRTGFHVLKLGGELLEQPDHVRQIAGLIAESSRTAPLVVVHGGGREINAALALAGVAKRQVDGIRVTDAETLGVVVATLAGTINTRLVAAVVAAGGGAVGLTGADAGTGLSQPSEPLVTREGRTVSLGLVGTPNGTGRPALLVHLCAGGYIPILASLGMSGDGSLLNVNADLFAAHLAVRLDAVRLIIAGGTPGVLDADRLTIPVLDEDWIEALSANGTARAGMLAKLGACRQAMRAGVPRVVIVDGFDFESLSAELSATPPERPRRGTRLVSSSSLSTVH
jgi:acetylglutamate kinase